MDPLIAKAHEYLDSLPKPRTTDFGMDPGVPLLPLLGCLANSVLSLAESADHIARANKSNYLLEQLQLIEACGYECEAGRLENNITWIELMKLAKGER